MPRSSADRPPRGALLPRRSIRPSCDPRPFHSDPSPPASGTPIALVHASVGCRERRRVEQLLPPRIPIPSRFLLPTLVAASHPAMTGCGRSRRRRRLTAGVDGRAHWRRWRLPYRDRNLRSRLAADQRRLHVGREAGDHQGDDTAAAQRHGRAGPIHAKVAGFFRRFSVRLRRRARSARQAPGIPGAGEGNRTLVVSLGSFCSTIELHPRRALYMAKPGRVARRRRGRGRRLSHRRRCHSCGFPIAARLAA